MALPVDVPFESRHPDWKKDANESIRPGLLKLSTFNPAAINNWTVKLTFKDVLGTNRDGSGFLVHFSASYDVILTAGHNMISSKAPTTDMKVHIGSVAVIPVTQSQYRVSASYSSDQTKEEDDFGAILLPLGTFAQYNVRCGFGYSLRLAYEEHLGGRMFVTGYRAITKAGAPDQADGVFVTCTANQLQYTANTEAGLSGSPVWMEYQGAPCVVAVQ